MVGVILDLKLNLGGKAGADSKDIIKAKTCINTPKDYTVILNDKEVAKVENDTQDGMGRIGLATWSTEARYDSVIVYGPDGPSAPVKANGKASLTWGYLKTQK